MHKKIDSCLSGTGVTFQCTYSSVVEVTSEEFSVGQSTAQGLQEASGSLAAGFKLKLNDDSVKEIKTTNSDILQTARGKSVTKT